MQSASNREVISRVRSTFKLQSTNTYQNITDRFILSELQSTAILYIKQVTDKRKLWNSPNIFTTIPCLKMRQVPVAECCGFSSECTIAKSVVPLPKIAEGTYFGMLIQGLYSIDTVSRKFIESTPDRYSNSLKLGLKTKAIHFFIQENYLYIGDEHIEKVKLSAYFEEDIPEALISYPTYCDQPLLKGCCPASDEVSTIQDMNNCCPVNPYDLPFKAPGYMVDSIVIAVAQKLSNTYKRSQEDKSLEGADTTK